MAKTLEILEPNAVVPAVPQYDDGAIVTMRIGGYLGALPYRQYPELDPADLRALNVGRRYLSERHVQGRLAKAQKAGEVDKPGKPTSAEFIKRELDSYVTPVGDSSEFTTVGSMRADICRDYLKEKFNLSDSPADRATIDKSVSTFLVHPRHGEEISRRLAAKFAEYVAPKKRDEKSGSVVDASTVVALNPDAA